jgi:hypothetical protein
MPVKLAISMLLARVVVVLALLASSRAAQAGSVLNICNVGNTVLFLVMVDQTPRGGYSIDGWRPIAMGECRSVTISFHSVVGFAITKTAGRKSMQVYDPTLFPYHALIPTEWRYCVDPEKDFHREATMLKALTDCKPGEVLARFAFHVKPKVGETVTLRIPADENGDVIAFQEPTTRVTETNFAAAMRGLAEQGERLGFTMEQHDRSPIASWPAYYIRELGIVVRPETHAVSVAKGSPSDRAGIRHRDEIVQIDDIALHSAWHARGLLLRMKPGETHAVTFLHDGQLLKKEINLEALPANLAATDLHPERGWLGIEFESSASVAGVIYQDAAAHLELDDDIQKIGREEFDGLDGLAEWLRRNQEAAALELQVRRPSTGNIFVMTLNRLK